MYGLGKHDTIELIAAAKSVASRMKVASLLVPGLGTMDDLRRGVDVGLDLIRVAVHCTEADVGAQHVMLGKKLGLETVMFFMMTHMTSPEALAQQAKMAEGYGADIIYFADSAGYMTAEQIEARVEAIRAAVHLPIGVHTHNNIGLGVSNAIAGIQAGCSFVDSTLEGLGAGCGNGNTQAITAVLEKMGYHTSCDLYQLIEVGSKEVRPLVRHSLENTGESIILGNIGVYSSFYLHVMEYVKLYGIAPRLIFEELGRRKVVGGQEDQIVEICHQILQKG
jgi:4-hydroxy 2-oxovalerate aldolase